MTIISILPWLFALVGIVLYFAAKTAEIKEAGRLAYFAGMFVALLVTSHALTIRIP